MQSLSTMKAVAKIVVRPKALTPEKYRLLCEKFPEGDRTNLFRIELPFDSSRIQEIRSFLEKEGLDRYHTSTVGYYGYQVLRRYEEADYQAADYLRMSPNQSIDIGRNPRKAKGKAIVDYSELEKGLWYEFKAGFTETAYFVLDSIKKTLETGSFVGMDFRGTEWSDPIRDFKRERIWELYSQIVLPKLANVKLLVHARNKSFTGDYSRPL